MKNISHMQIVGFTFQKYNYFTFVNNPLDSQINTTFLYN